ncbi:MAG: monovalent cation/H+ antiporter subunit D [Rhodocyclaceae bacterium]|nr:monovalent cation/H+ antiporter subunit D [Rhodocyclaceae bacterium]
MNLLLAAPVVIPIVAAAALVVMRGASATARHAVGIAATLTFLAIAVVLFAHAADGRSEVLLVGNWRVPFGIALLLDRLSAWMLLLTGFVGVAALLAAIGGGQARALHFHALFQAQLAGVAGAFLTNDLFNLFVFFEVLLAASYGLLLYSGERQTRGASLHYIIFNLVGSLLFLIAAGLIYGIAGTLSFAELATIGGKVSADDMPMLQAAMLLLLVVFSIKAAALPLGLWLPATYGAADAPVAALFALLTKVGIYAVVRVFVGVFGTMAPDSPWIYLSSAIPWVGALTLLFGALGALAAHHLRGLAASLVLASAGTLLIGTGLPGGVAAAMYYAAHSTLAGAALFLVADVIRRGRGRVEDRLEPAPAVGRAGLIGGMFFVVAVAIAGLPPLSGFIGKSMLIAELFSHDGRGHLAAAVLLGSLTTLIALSRAGSTLFWHAEPHAPGEHVRRGGRGSLYGAGMLLGGLLALVVAAGPAQRYVGQLAEQVDATRADARAILDTQPRPQYGRQP